MSDPNEVELEVEDFEALRMRCASAQRQLGDAAAAIREQRRRCVEAEAKAQLADARAREAESARRALAEEFAGLTKVRPRALAFFRAFPPRAAPSPFPARFPL